MAMIHLIRHGQASFLKSNYDKLSELGIAQSKVLGEALKERKAIAGKIVGGSLVRHQETAEHCLKVLGKSGFTENAHWNEYDHMELLVTHNPDFADFEKLSDFIKSQKEPLRSLQQLLNASIQDWIDDKYDYSVRWETFKSNVRNALQELAARVEKDENAWVFTSGGPISAVMVQLLNLKDEQFIDLQGRLVNTSITKILVGRSGLSLSTYNDYSHLDSQPEMITYR